MLIEALVTSYVTISCEIVSIKLYPYCQYVRYGRLTKFSSSELFLKGLPWSILFVSDIIFQSKCFCFCWCSVSDVQLPNWNENFPRIIWPLLASRTRFHNYVVYKRAFARGYNCIRHIKKYIPEYVNLFASDLHLTGWVRVLVLCA